MRHIVGFVYHYSKVHTLQLIRKDDALFRTTAAGAGKVALSKLAWSVLIVQTNDVRKVNQHSNAQRCMHMNDAYFALYEMKKLFDRILHELQYLDKVHPHHFTLDQLDRIFEYRFIQSSNYSFPNQCRTQVYV